MPRTSRSATLDSKTKRLGLEKAKFYTETLANGCYLVYRRPQSDAAGTFYVRWKSPETKKFKYSKIGDADDVVKADGVAVYTYQQAKDWGKDWFKRCGRTDQAEASGEAVPKGEWTIKDVIDFYIADARKTRKDPKTAEDALQAANANILPELGAIAIPRLTRGRVEKWHADLAGRGRRKTGWKRKPGEEVEFLSLDPTDKMAVKRRKSSANRDLALLKSALNLAAEKGKIDREHLPWISVKPFKGVKGRRVRFLNLAEQASLVNACTPEFRQLVCGALYTGARYGELTNAKVGDLDLEAGALWVDGKGRDSMPRWIFLTEEGEDWFRQMVDGRRKEEHLFLRSGIIRKGAGEEISTLKNAQVNLSPSEGLMLRALLERNGQFVAYDDLRSALWSDLENGRRKVTNTLDQLRRKMKAAGIQFEVQGGRTELRFEVPEPQSFVFERQASELPKEVLNGPGPWRKDDAKIPMQQALKAAKLERMTFHELRHTYASMLVNSGVPLKVIAEQLGHVDTRMVEEHYGHLCQTAKRDTIRALSPMRLTGQPLQRPKAKMSDLKKAGGV